MTRKLTKNLRNSMLLRSLGKVAIPLAMLASLSLTACGRPFDARPCRPIGIGNACVEMRDGLDLNMSAIRAGITFAIQEAVNNHPEDFDNFDDVRDNQDFVMAFVLQRPAFMADNRDGETRSAADGISSFILAQYVHGEPAYAEMAIVHETLHALLFSIGQDARHKTKDYFTQHVGFASVEEQAQVDFAFFLHDKGLPANPYFQGE